MPRSSAHDAWGRVCMETHFCYHLLDLPVTLCLASGAEGGSEQGDEEQQEETAARLIFTTEQPLPWLERLTTHIKACAHSQMWTVMCSAPQLLLPVAMPRASH